MPEYQPHRRGEKAWRDCASEKCCALLLSNIPHLFPSTSFVALPRHLPTSFTYLQFAFMSVRTSRADWVMKILHYRSESVLQSSASIIPRTKIYVNFRKRRNCIIGAPWPVVCTFVPPRRPLLASAPATILARRYNRFANTGGRGRTFVCSPGRSFVGVLLASFPSVCHSPSAHLFKTVQ